MRDRLLSHGRQDAAHAVCNTSSSTSFFCDQDVDGRDKPGHDGRGMVQNDRNPLF
jgi:hypothetical protein